MLGAVKIGSYKDAPVYAHWTCLLIIGGLMLIVNRPIDILWVFIDALSIGACILLHEWAHLSMAARFGIKATYIVFLPAGATTSYERSAATLSQELCIALAGPLANALVALALFLLWQPFVYFSFKGESLSIVLGYNYLLGLYVVNIFLAVINLIPAFPFDGGSITRAFLASRLNYVKATNIMAAVSRTIGILFIFGSFLSGNILLLLTGIFVFSAGAAARYNLLVKEFVRAIKVKEVTMNEYLMLHPDMTVKEVAPLLTQNAGKYFIVIEECKPVGIINRFKLINAIAEMNYDEKVSQLMNRKVIVFDGEKKVADIIDQVAGKEDRIFPVIENNCLTGVTSFNHIMEYMLIQQSGQPGYHHIKTLAGIR